MNDTVLFILLMLLFVGFVRIVIYLWFQFNSTTSRLTKYIENRIRLYNVNENIRSAEEIIEEE